jgi:hypothetical protein
VSLARFKAWINASNFKKTPSRPFGCSDEAIIETRGGCEKRAWVIGWAPNNVYRLAGLPSIQQRMQKYGTTGYWVPACMRFFLYLIAREVCTSSVKPLEMTLRTDSPSRNVRTANVPFPNCIGNLPYQQPCVQSASGTLTAPQIGSWKKRLATIS